MLSLQRLQLARQQRGRLGERVIIGIAESTARIASVRGRLDDRSIPFACGIETMYKHHERQFGRPGPPVVIHAQAVLGPHLHWNRGACGAIAASCSSSARRTNPALAPSPPARGAAFTSESADAMHATHANHAAQLLLSNRGDFRAPRRTLEWQAIRNMASDSFLAACTANSHSRSHAAVFYTSSVNTNKNVTRFTAQTLP